MSSKKLRGFYNFYYDLKLTNKLIIFTVIISVIPIILISYIFYHKSEQIIYNEVKSSYNQILSQYIDNVHYKLNLYNTLMNNVTFNGIIQETFQNEPMPEYSSNMDIISKISSQIDFLALDKYENETYNITFYPLDEAYTYYQAHIGNLSTIKETEWYKELFSGELPSYSGITQTKWINKNSLILVRTIPSLKFDTYRKVIGVVKLDVYADKLFSVKNETHKNQKQFIYILDKNNEVKYSTDEKSMINSVFPEGKFKGDNSEVDLYDKSGILVSGSITPYGWRALMLFESSEIQKKINDTGISIVVTAMLISLLVLCNIVIFSKEFSKRVDLLLNKMKKVKNGDMEISNTIRGKDEIAMLDRDFNDMIFRLKELISENYIQKIEKREAQLNALQAQINPHFLYNTLEAINSIASIYRCMEICTISQKLGEIFRYNINSDKNEYVSLREEINHIKNYECIQRIRFDDNVIIHFEILEELYEHKVLKFILQPIVENVFYHAFSDEKPKGNIRISSRLVNLTLIIKVEDDGIGIASEKLQQINNYINEKNDNIQEKRKRSIGIKNVNSRIKLSYGEKYGLLLESLVNQGTIVTITLPAEST